MGAALAGGDTTAATCRRRSAGEGDDVRSGMETLEPCSTSLNIGDGDLLADKVGEMNAEEPEAV